MRLSSCILLFAILLQIKTKADNEKYQITLLLSPTYETFTGTKRLPKLSYNFGIDYKHYLDPKITFQTGIVYQNKGFRGYDQISLLSSTTELTRYALHYISIPTNFNIHIQTGVRNRILLTIGMSNGYSIHQSRRMMEITQEDISKYRDEYGVAVSDNSEKIDWFSKRCTTFNLGIGFMQFVKKKVVFEVHPIYSVQLNNPYNNKNYSIKGNENYKLKSLAIDLKIGYYINRQISQTEKSF